jgi:hypothetical protein
MVDRSRQGSGGNGAIAKPETSTLRDLLQQYLDSFVPDADHLEVPSPSAVDTLDSDEPEPLPELSGSCVKVVIPSQQTY